MQFLKTLFWVLVAVAVTFFAYRNWTPVPLRLWDDIVADVNLPLLLLVTFLLGFLPTWALMRTRLWSHRRRIDALERTHASAASATAAREDGEPVE